MKKRFLILEDGTSYCGASFGSQAITTGKIVVNSNMLGYQESITNSVYQNQIVVFTQPSIGNTGINHKNYETINPSIKGVIVREYSNISTNRRQRLSLDQFMKQNNIPGISGLDTRELAHHIKKYGSMKASIVDIDDQHAFDQLHASVFNHQQVSKVSTPKAFVDPGDGYNIVVIDLGLKNNLLKELSKRNCNVVVVPWNTSSQRILELDPDGVLLSTGPGSPNDLPPAIFKTVQIIQAQIPLFAVGLGHEIFAKANGAKITPMKSTYNGSNHPVRRIITNQIVHVSQNQGYIIQAHSIISAPLFVTYVDLVNRSIQGLHHSHYPAFSVQFNPGGAPGPDDSVELYDEFLENIRSVRGHR